MVWIFVFGGIAVVGLVMVVAYAVWLSHKMSDLFAELRVLGQRTGKMADLVARIEVPELGTGPERLTDPDEIETPRHRDPVADDVG